MFHCSLKGLKMMMNPTLTVWTFDTAPIGADISSPDACSGPVVCIGQGGIQTMSQKVL